MYPRPARCCTRGHAGWWRRRATRPHYRGACCCRALRLSNQLFQRSKGRIFVLLWESPGSEVAQGSDELVVVNLPPASLHSSERNVNLRAADRLALDLQQAPMSSTTHPTRRVRMLSTPYLGFTAELRELRSQTKRPRVRVCQDAGSHDALTLAPSMRPPFARSPKAQNAKKTSRRSSSAMMVAVLECWGVWAGV